MTRSRRQPLILLMCLGLIASAVLTTGSSAIADDESVSATVPNVLVINLDDATELMIDWKKPDGSWVMPNAQAFKLESTTYSNTFVDIPSCCPSRFSTFTGRYPHNTGGKQQHDGVDLPAKETFVYQLRKSAQFATAMAGKFLAPWKLPKPPPSYDRYTVIKGGYNDPLMNRNGFVDFIDGYSTTLLADDLRGYLTEFEAADDSQPWYAYWSPQAPHVSGEWKSLAIPESKYADVDMGVCAQPVEKDRSDKPPYVDYTRIDRDYNQALCESQLRAMITVDERFGDLLAQLRDDDEYDDTMVVLTSDNGHHWGEQGWFSKFFPYEASISIPLVVKWPAALGVAPGVDDRLASSLDLTASIFEVTGTQPVTELDGDSLLAPPTRQEVLAEYFKDRNNGGGIPSWSLLRGPTWKYVETRTKEDDGTTTLFTEYYDLITDPGEFTNVLNDGVIGNEPPDSVLRALASRLRAARECAGDDCP